MVRVSQPWQVFRFQAAAYFVQTNDDRPPERVNSAVVFSERFRGPRAPFGVRCCRPPPVVVVAVPFSSRPSTKSGRVLERAGARARGRVRVGRPLRRHAAARWRHALTSSFPRGRWLTRRYTRTPADRSNGQRYSVRTRGYVCRRRVQRVRERER